MKRLASAGPWLAAAFGLWMVASSASAQTASIYWNNFEEVKLTYDGDYYFRGPGTDLWWSSGQGEARPGPANGFIHSTESFYQWSALSVRVNTAPGTYCRARINITESDYHSNWSFNPGPSGGIFFSALNDDGSVRDETGPYEGLSPGQTIRPELWFVAPGPVTILRVGQWGNGYANSYVLVDDLHVQCGIAQG